ncbi:MAG: hypothetical protein AVDCRST_MAG32-1617 [uncultured Nocardioides sp.]|uniref:Uncharacterized protein n=1 Tax=uncultured Nocardioides sp. TaxID=198441 RepID=A0A6J4N7Y5_9ACTN|nr:MAG: hypothetical protein AVDCRST_MAG32-1617 [uncultured Nocardioides sp.]
MRPLLATLLALPLLAGCTEPDTTTVALLLADEAGSTARGARIVDVEVLTDRIASACEECELEVYDAGGDADEQVSQVRQALAAESDVLAVWPVDAAQVGEVVPEDVPVVSLVTLVPGSEQFVGLAEGEPDLPPQGTDLEAAREVVLGKRKQMTFVPVRALSEQAADVVVGQLAEKPLTGGTEHEGVPSWLYETTRVTLDTLTTVLVGQGVLDLEELCQGRVAERCTQLGLR